MEKEFRSLEVMPDEYKILYVNFILPLVKADPFNLPVRLGELQMLMNRINLKEDIQYNILNSVFSDTAKWEYSNLISKLNTLKLSEQEKSAFKYSIIKDMVNIAYSSGYITEEASKIINDLAYRFFGDKKDEIIKTIKDLIENEKKFIRGEIGIDEFERRVKTLASLVPSIGVPIAAVYFSGSVVGLSAAGITSGLAALGLGGLFGLSAMVTGIGVVIGIGIVTYKTVRWVLGINEREAERKREELIKQTILNYEKAIKTISTILNKLYNEIKLLVEHAEEHKHEIEKLKQKIEAYRKAFEYLKQAKDNLAKST